MKAFIIITKPDEHYDKYNKLVHDVSDSFGSANLCSITFLNRDYQCADWSPNEQHHLLIPQPLSFSSETDNRQKSYSEYFHFVLSRLKKVTDKYEDLFLIIHAGELYENYVPGGSINLSDNCSFNATDLYTRRVHLYCFHHDSGDMNKVIFEDDIDNDYFSRIEHLCI